MPAPLPRSLSTTAGELPLHEYRLSLGGRTWSILHTGAILSHEDEEQFLRGDQPRLPYGIALWPAAIALAHELAVRPLRGVRVLELGAGTGLPGIVAAALGARVVQTDRNAGALIVCRMNAEGNDVVVEQRAADWTAWQETDTFDLIIGADILYADSVHPASSCSRQWTRRAGPWRSTSGRWVWCRRRARSACSS
jgi:predicted nicotinamide N-methyase